MLSVSNKTRKSRLLSWQHETRSMGVTSSSKRVGTSVELIVESFGKQTDDSKESTGSQLWYSEVLLGAT